jgi:predicted RNA-binding Zn ribbon-like protein
MEETRSPRLAEPGAPAIFVANNAGLDFLNSIASPVDVPVEWLGDGEALTEWLRQAEMVPEEALRTLTNRAGPGELDAIAGQARALREWFRGFVHKHRGKPLSRSALEQLEPINRILMRDERYGQIASGENRHGHENSSPLIWLEKRNWRSSESLLIPIAESMARLVSEEDFTHVKACEGNACTLLFLDKTRRSARRWCSMAICGNRAKVAAFRTRGQERMSPE